MNHRMWPNPTLKVLVDMDCVVADFEAHVLEWFRKMYPDEPFIPLKDRRGFYVTHQYGDIRPDLKDKIISVITTEGFFQTMPEIEGAVNAVKEMDSLEDVEVFFCTSPLRSFHFCVKEKYEWIEKHFGKPWIDKLILTRDKTIINADLLIDDRPDIKGVNKHPVWKQVLFTACHNIHSKVPRGAVRLQNWTDKNGWLNIIEDAKKRL